MAFPAPSGKGNESRSGDVTRTEEKTMRDARSKTALGALAPVLAARRRVSFRLNGVYGTEPYLQAGGGLKCYDFDEDDARKLALGG